MTKALFCLISSQAAFQENVGRQVCDSSTDYIYIVTNWITVIWSLFAAKCPCLAQTCLVSENFWSKETASEYDSRAPAITQFLPVL